MEAQRTTKITVDGVKYTIFRLDTVVAWKFFWKLSSVLGPQFLELAINFQKKGKSFLDIEVSRMGSLMNETLMNINDEQFLNHFLNMTLDPDRVIPVTGKYMDINSYFNQFGPFHMLKVQIEVLRFNFSDFLGLFKGLNKDQQQGKSNSQYTKKVKTQ